MNILINKIHYPVTVLGFGSRLGIWFQGCSIHCKGCISKDTWDFNPSNGVDVDKLVENCQELTGLNLDGITISGGEPFDQPEALLDLLERLLQWRETGMTLDILCYSGYPFSYLKKRFSNILHLLDVVISEPFQEELETIQLRGSSNQTFNLLSPLAEVRYRTRNSDQLAINRFQFSMEDGQGWFVGIPNRGSMEELTERLLKRGIILGKTSWHS